MKKKYDTSFIFVDEKNFAELSCKKNDSKKLERLIN